MSRKMHETPLTEEEIIRLHNYLDTYEDAEVIDDTTARMIIQWVKRDVSNILIVTA